MGTFKACGFVINYNDKTFDKLSAEKKKEYLEKRIKTSLGKDAKVPSNVQKVLDGLTTPVPTPVSVKDAENKIEIK